MKAARLAVLTVALAAGGVAALLAGRNEPPPHSKVAQAPKLATVDVLVAKTDITMGQPITPRDIGWQGWPESANHGNFIRRKDHPTAIESLSGAIARAAFVAGEPIRDAKLIMAKGSGLMAAILPKGMRAVSISVSPETAVSGFILPNDHVDVVQYKSDHKTEKRVGGEHGTVETILRDVRVLAIDQHITEKNGQKVVVGKTATLELTPRQVEAIALARNTGSLFLALRSIADIGKSQPQAGSDDDLGKHINIIRFGMTSVVTPQ